MQDFSRGGGVICLCLCVTTLVHLTLNYHPPIGCPTYEIATQARFLFPYKAVHNTGSNIRDPHLCTYDTEFFVSQLYFIQILSMQEMLFCIFPSTSGWL